MSFLLYYNCTKKGSKVKLLKQCTKVRFNNIIGLVGTEKLNLVLLMKFSREGYSRLRNKKISTHIKFLPFFPPVSPYISYLKELNSYVQFFFTFSPLGVCLCAFTMSFPMKTGQPILP